MRFDGKVAVVTGAGQGMGRSIALRLAKEGADVAVVEYIPETAKKVAEEIKALGRKAIHVIADVTQEEEVKKAVQTVLNNFQKIDILVNVVGGAGPPKSVTAEGAEYEVEGTTPTEASAAYFDRMLDLNLRSTFLCSKYVAAHMKNRNYGKIVNISSTEGKRCKHGLLGFYAAAKAGVIQLSRGLAIELAPYGINVNTICPGYIDTPLLRWQRNFMAEKIGVSEEELKQSAFMEIPLRRYGSPEDIAGAVAFLVSSDSDYITGQAINVDGGLESY